MSVRPKVSATAERDDYTERGCSHIHLGVGRGSDKLLLDKSAPGEGTDRCKSLGQPRLPRGQQTGVAQETAWGLVRESREEGRHRKDLLAGLSRGENNGEVLNRGVHTENTDVREILHLDWRKPSPPP